MKLYKIINLDKEMFKGMFTTTEVGRILGESPRTIAKYVDSGELGCERRAPSYKHRLIPSDSLIEFMEKYSIPLELIREHNRKFY